LARTTNFFVSDLSKEGSVIAEDGGSHPGAMRQLLSVTKDGADSFNQFIAGVACCLS
jgi:hypothetical protein